MQIQTHTKRTHSFSACSAAEAPSPLRTRGRIGRVLRRGHRGSAAVAALAALVVAFVIIAGLLTVAMQTVLRGNQQRNASAATYVAAAGVQYGYWQYIYNSATLPYSGSATLPGGSFTVQVTDNSANIANTIQVAATGAHGKTSISLTRIYNVPASDHIFDYAFVLNQSIASNWYPILGASGSGGNMRVNGSITLNNASTKINGDATASGAISITSVTGTKTPNSAAYSFPVLNAATYEALADRTVSATMSGSFSFTSANEIVYTGVGVGLAVNTATTIHGTGVIFVDGDMTIDANLSYAANSHVVFLITGYLTVNGSVSSLVGCFYVHNTSTYINTELNGSITSWNGSLVTDAINLNAASDKMQITADPFFTAAQGSTMHLPGY